MRMWAYSQTSTVYRTFNRHLTMYTYILNCWSSFLKNCLSEGLPEIVLEGGWAANIVCCILYRVRGIHVLDFHCPKGGSLS